MGNEYIAKEGVRYKVLDTPVKEQRLSESTETAGYGKWINLNVCRPKRGDRCWLYDKAFDRVEYVEVEFNPADIDLDYTHWMMATERP